MKAFWMDPDNTVYAAESEEAAAHIYKSTTGEDVDEFYPQEITDAELDTEQIKHDERGQPTKFKTTIREYLNAAEEPGFLCGINL